MLVASCGAGSRLVRTIAPLKKDPRNHATGIRQYYEGINGVEKGNSVDFYFLDKFLPGYLWIFPLPDGRANVGAGIRTDILKKRRVNLKTIMDEAIIQYPHLAERFQNARPVSAVSAWDLPLGSKKIPLSGNRFILTGDAAFLIDPFTGEGVGNAMWSGYAAAEHIEKTLAANRFDAAFNKQFDQFVYKKLWKELRISTSIQQLISYRKLFNFVMNKATDSEYLRQSITRMIDDLDERKNLRRPWWYLRILLGK
jgi:flavin-dependent dehydrogenase